MFKEDLTNFTKQIFVPVLKKEIEDGNVATIYSYKDRDKNEICKWYLSLLTRSQYNYVTNLAFNILKDKGYETEINVYHGSYEYDKEKLCYTLEEYLNNKGYFELALMVDKLNIWDLEILADTFDDYQQKNYKGYTDTNVDNPKNHIMYVFKRLSESQLENFFELLYTDEKIFRAKDYRVWHNEDEREVELVTRYVISLGLEDKLTVKQITSLSLYLLFFINEEVVGYEEEYGKYQSKAELKRKFLRLYKDY